LQPTIELPIARIGMAFGILFFTTLLVGGIIELLLTELINKTGLTISDRFAGMIFGAGRGLVVVSLCIMLAGLTSLPEDPWWKESILIPPFQTLAIWIREHIPSGLAGYVNYH
ncbi:MAG: CvpA family protein, partial [Methylicorpusculum sp.]|nr:CvpA family protein [Methylicorpusculum sp.]